MLIILEGADGTGKTTVADGLLNFISADVMHAAQPQGTWIDEYVTPLIDYLPAQTTTAHRHIGDALPNAGHKHIICDRWHWGETIYGPLYRGGSILDEAKMDYMSRFLTSKGAVIVHMWNTEEAIRARWAERGEDFLQPEHLAGVLAAYHELARTSPVPVLSCRDVDTPRLHQIIGLAKIFEEAATELYGGAS